MLYDIWIIVSRILIALLCGGIVGFERESEQKPAGLRTIILVTLGSTLVMLLAERAPDFLKVEVDMVSMDPTRILGSLMQGIGFLGAGTIFTHRRTIHGLTTAAAIWTMAAVGAAVGIGDLPTAFAGTLAAFFVLRVLGPLNAYIERRYNEREAKKHKDKGKARSKH